MEEIYNANATLIHIHADLQSLHSIVSCVEGNWDKPLQEDMLAVVRRTLEPIIQELQGAMDTIDLALCRIEDNEDEKEAP